MLGSALLASALDLIVLALLADAAMQLRKALKSNHMNLCDKETPPMACTLGRIGLDTHAAVFEVFACCSRATGSSRRST